MGHEPALEGRHPLLRRDVVALRAASREWPAAVQSADGSNCTDLSGVNAGRADRWPSSRCAPTRRPSWLAGRRRWPVGAHLPRPELYPANSTRVVRRINNALQRADQIAKIRGRCFIWRRCRRHGELRGGAGITSCRKPDLGVAVHTGRTVGFYSEKSATTWAGPGVDPAHPADVCSARGRWLADVPTVVIACTDAEGGPLITSSTQ